MSETYQDLPETVFPDEVDTSIRMSDLASGDLSAVNQYYTLYNAGDLSGAAAVLAANPQ